MTAGFRGLFSLGIAASLGVLASCDGGPTTPSTPAPPPAVGPAVVGIQIGGPSSIEPGSTAQLAARLLRSDGSNEDITNQAGWSSTNQPVLQVDATGLARAAAGGEADVVARYQSWSATARILVLPAGTFRVSGTVVDEAGLPLPGAVVSIDSGPLEDLRAETSESGAYALYGLAGRTTIQAQKAGYRDRVFNVLVTRHMELYFQLPIDPSHPANIDLGGAYRLTLTSGCPQSLPAAARVRTYAAVIEQQGHSLMVRLGGADFVVTAGRGDRFTGFVRPDRTIAFVLHDAYYYGYPLGQLDLVERFPPTGVLVVSGTAMATSNEGAISGTLKGMTALTHRVTAPFLPFNEGCHQGDHRFEMQRQ